MSESIMAIFTSLFCYIITKRHLEFVAAKQMRPIVQRLTRRPRRLIMNAQFAFLAMHRIKTYPDSKMSGQHTKNSIHTVGHSKVDADHERIMTLLSELEDLAISGQPSAALKAKLVELVSFTTKHFREEEAIFNQLTIAQDKVHTHQKIHQDLLRRLNENLHGFERDGVLSESFFSFVKAWMSSHTEEDQKMF